MATDYRKAAQSLLDGELVGHVDLDTMASAAVHALLAIHDLLDERLSKPEPRCPAREHRDRLNTAVPHGPDEPCTCPGCWACDGHVTGCTCDIDWDTDQDLRLGGSPSHEPGCTCDSDRDPQPDTDTVTLRRDDVEALLNHGVLSPTQRADAVRRVRAALGWGDEA